jgi:hypothetical protein
VRELAVGGQHEQPRRADGHAPDADPPAVRRPRQRVENRTPSFWILARSELAGRFVIREVGMRAFPVRALERDGRSVEHDLLGPFDSLTEDRGFSADDDAPLFDPTLDLPPRTEP